MRAAGPLMRGFLDPFSGRCLRLRGQLAEAQAEAREVVNADDCYWNKAENVKSNRPARRRCRGDGIYRQSHRCELLEYAKKSRSGREGNPQCDEQLEKKRRGKAEMNPYREKAEPEGQCVRQPMGDSPRQRSEERRV